MFMNRRTVTTKIQHLIITYIILSLLYFGFFTITLAFVNGANVFYKRIIILCNGTLNIKMLSHYIGVLFS